METHTTREPVLGSIFTDSSGNEAFQNDPLGGVHKHGPTCKGDVRGVIFPLSPEARICCEAEPKEDEALGQIVALRLCKESTYFSIGTSLIGNVTITCPKQVADDDPDWKTQIQVSIYPDPDSNDAELYNASPRLTILVMAIISAKRRRAYRIHPHQHFRLNADCSWAIKITKLHTFGLILCSDRGYCNALTPEHAPRRKPKSAPKETNSMRKSFRCTSGNEDGETTKVLRRINLQALLGTDDAAVCAILDENSPWPICDDVPLVLFEDRKTIVEEISGEMVKKKIRNTSLQEATVQWHKEVATLRRLTHPQIIKTIAWDQNDLSIEFEHGGSDLASLRNKANNMFNVAINIRQVQYLVWIGIAKALGYLHNVVKIKHLDVKPHNILLSADHKISKLCDFGHAQAIDQDVRGGGTPFYIAPEFLLNGKMSAAQDIWALGVTMLYLYRFIPLPGTESGVEAWQINQVKNNNMERRKMRKWLGVVAEARQKIPDNLSLLKDMLDPSPKTRITAQKLVQRLKEIATIEYSEQRALLVA